MRYFVLLAIFLQFWAGPVWAANDHGLNPPQEQEARDLDGHTPSVITGCDWVVPSSSLTFAAVACDAYVKNGERLVFARAAAVAVTLPAVDGLHWLGMRGNPNVLPVGWTVGGFGSHVIHQQAAVQPAPQDDVLVVVKVTVLTEITGIGQVASVTSTACINTARYASIQAAIDATPARGRVCITPVVHTMPAGRLTINKALMLQGYGATLDFTTDAITQGIYVTASDVSIFGLTITGPQSTVSTVDQSGINAEGADSSNFISHLTIRDVKISNFGDACIETRFSENFDISHNLSLVDCHTYGIELLSVRHGDVSHNTIKRIDADGVVGTNAWGITVTKNNGTEATFPASHDVMIDFNDISESITWACLDTHGGQSITFANNNLLNCVLGINVVSYISTDPRAPRNVTVSNNTIRNDHGPGETIAPTDQAYCIGINGNIGVGVTGVNIVVDGNACDGFGDEDGVVDETFSGSIFAQQVTSLLVTDNILQNNHRNGMLFRSITALNASNNSILGIVGGATPIAATGTITCSGGVPSAGETVTINGAKWFWRAAASLDYEVTIGADANASCTNLFTELNAQVGGGTEEDGRVAVATYVDNTGSIAITYVEVGRSGNTFTLAEASTNVTIVGCADPCVSATLAGGAIGSAGMHFKTLSGGADSIGKVSGNFFQLTGYTAIQKEGDSLALDFSDNSTSTVSTLYDLLGTGLTPQSGVGTIAPVAQRRWVKDLDSIIDGANEMFYIPMPAVSNDMQITVSAVLPLMGLFISARGNNGGYAEVLVQNESGGPVDFDPATWFAHAVRIQDR